MSIMLENVATGMWEMGAMRRGAMPTVMIAKRGGNIFIIVANL